MSVYLIKYCYINDYSIVLVYNYLVNTFGNMNNYGVNDDDGDCNYNYNGVDNVGSDNNEPS